MSRFRVVRWGRDPVEITRGGDYGPVDIIRHWIPGDLYLIGVDETGFEVRVPWNETEAIPEMFELEWLG